MRLDAFYYSLEETGVPEIDRILSAVDSAGKAFHHTDKWNEESCWNPEGFAGKTPVEWIQNAANEAAAKISLLTNPASEGIVPPSMAKVEPTK